MTTTEALDLVTTASPDRSFFVNKEVVQFNPKKRETKYKISVLPGFDGKDCQQFSHPDGFDKPVADCLALAKSVAATENNE